MLVLEIVVAPAVGNNPAGTETEGDLFEAVVVIYFGFFEVPAAERDTGVASLGAKLGLPGDVINHAARSHEAEED